MKIKNYMWQVPILLIVVCIADFIIDGKVNIFSNSILFIGGMIYYKRFVK